MIKKICKQCKKEFEVWPCLKNIRKYCSHRCYVLSNKGKHLSPDTEFKKGIVPWNKGIIGIIKPNQTSFKKGNISWIKERTKKIKKFCLTCQKEFESHSSAKRKFCSWECYLKNPNKYWIGKKRSDDTKRKISDIMLKNPTRYWLGRKRPKETGKRISKALKGKLSCEKHWNWQGGIGKEPYAFEFNKELKLFIRQRDDFTCQVCGLKENGRAHNVHHIDYNKKNSLLSNLILLCNVCNARANYKREYWQNYFQKNISGE